MPELDILAILISAVVVFLIGGAHYSALGEQLAQVSEAAGAAATQPPPWELVVGKDGGDPCRRLVAEAARRRRDRQPLALAAGSTKFTPIGGRAWDHPWLMPAGGNVYDKYATRNPVERRLVGGFLEQLGELVDRTGARDAHEVGCGEGELSMMLARRGLAVRGSDISPGVIDEARGRAGKAGLEISFKGASIDELDPLADSAALVVCCEVLEHLPDPHGGLETLAALARPWLIVSVPREPIWRALNLARLKYVGALGNTPGHLGHWSRRSFLDFLRERVEVVEVRSPLPWTMALCRSDGRLP